MYMYYRERKSNGTKPKDMYSATKLSNTFHIHVYLTLGPVNNIDKKGDLLRRTTGHRIKTKIPTSAMRKKSLDAP